MDLATLSKQISSKAQTSVVRCELVPGRHL